jgi:AcrR family transcriptional regulator
LTEQHSDLDRRLRHVPVQARSRERLQRVLDAADRVLAEEGAEAFTTTRVAEAAGIPVGSVYRFFPDKEAIVEALAVQYWTDFDDLVAATAELAEQSGIEDPGGTVLGALAAGFRSRPGFMALWYGGLRTSQVRDATRPTRTSIARSVERVLSVCWPGGDARIRPVAAQMVVLAGDGLLREAFRRDPRGDAALLAESGVMLNAYLAHRLA